MKTYSITADRQLTTRTIIPGAIFDEMTEYLSFQEKEALNRLNHRKKFLVFEIGMAIALALLALFVVANARFFALQVVAASFGPMFVYALFRLLSLRRRVLALWADMVKKHETFQMEFFHTNIYYPTLRIDQIVGEVRQELVRELGKPGPQRFSEMFHTAKDCLGHKLDLGRGVNFFHKPKEQMAKEQAA